MFFGFSALPFFTNRWGVVFFGVCGVLVIILWFLHGWRFEMGVLRCFMGGFRGFRRLGS